MINLEDLIRQVLLEEKKKRDRCLRIADRKFEKPSAYKSGAVVRCRQGKIWKGIKETEDPQSGKAAPYGSGYAKINEYSNKIIAQLTTKFKLEKPDLDDNIITTYIERFSQIKDSPNVSQKDITKYTWDDLEKVIGDNLPKRIKAGKINDGEPSKDANLVYNQNNLRIYAGATKEACIKYGNGYSFCISARGSNNMYSNYRLEQHGTPYFVFDDTKTSAQTTPEKFKDPNHLLVVLAYDYGYTVTNANNDEAEGFNDFNDLEGIYPRLKGLKNIFQPIEVNPKEKAEYETTIKYGDYFNKLTKFYLEKKYIDPNDFGFFSIKSANTLIDDAINGNTQLYAINASKKDKNNGFFGNPYQVKLYKSNESEDNIKKDFAINMLMFKYNDTSLEDVLNNWDIKVFKIKKPVYTQYFQDVKKLVDEYRGEMAKLKLLKENLSKIIQEIIQEDESLRKWFKRQGPSGKEGGWVDCNTCRKVDGKTKCKACGRKKGEKRAKYPSCRPTPSQCKQPGKGKKWGKTK